MLKISGNYEQGGDGSLRFEIAGTEAATQYDQFLVDGQATLAGQLEVVLLEGFQPTIGDHFDILKLHAMEGRFDRLRLPALSAGLGWDQSQLYTLGRISVVSVPEPATWNLVFLPLVAFGMQLTRRQI